MKKQLTILLLFFFNCTFLCAQKFIKTTGPCDDEILKNVQGEWIHRGDPWYAKLSKQQEQEVRNRVATIHQFVFNLTPTLSGLDAAWGIHSSDYDFAQQARIEYLTDGQTRTSYYNGIPVVEYTYSIGFYEYSCGKYGDNNFMRKGYPREDGATLSVSVNTLNNFLLRDYGGTDGMQIDGRKIKMMPPIKEKWKGYQLYTPEIGSDVTMVLLHRDGILPYIPVTRKQYLDVSIEYLQKLFDKNIKAYDDPALVALTDKKQKDENIKTDQKLRDDILNYYRKELETTIKAGLSDSPAIIPVTLAYPDMNVPIFTTSEAGGYMLATENPKYFRKDLPKYTPQLFILSIDRIKWWFTPKIDPIKILEDRFPIEKLQALIDK